MTAQESGGKLKVHVAPIGYYLDRVWEVPIRWNADRLWLIVDGDPSPARERPYRDMIKRHLTRTRPRLEIREFETSLWDIPSLLRAYGTVVRTEMAAGNEVWINVSTGSKMDAVAGALVAMAHGAHLYYALAKTHSVPLQKRGSRKVVPLTTGVSRVLELPEYRLDSPSEDHLEVLRAIERLGGLEMKSPVRKVDVVQTLLAGPWKGEVQPKRARSPAQGAHMRLNRLLEALVRPPAKVEQSGATRRRRVSLTEEGRLLLLLLGG